MALPTGVEHYTGAYFNVVGSIPTPVTTQITYISLTFHLFGWPVCLHIGLQNIFIYSTFGLLIYHKHIFYYPSFDTPVVEMCIHTSGTPVALVCLHTRTILCHTVYHLCASGVHAHHFHIYHTGVSNFYSCATPVAHLPL